MKQSLVNILIGVLVIGIIAFFGFVVGRHSVKLPEPEIIERTDTLVVTDTLRVTEPIEIYREVKDTILVEITDYLVVHDTTFVSLPREYVTYKDSAYSAVVSGFLPRLEEITVYPKTQYITIQTEKITTVKKNPRFSIGIQAGYGITPAGFQPYLGVGGEFNIISF